MSRLHGVLFSMFTYGLCCVGVYGAESRSDVGAVERFEGSVKHYQDGAVKGKKLNENGVPLKANDSLRTMRQATAFLTLVDGSQIILTERSRIHFLDAKKVSAEQGKILFNIQKQGGLKGFEIATSTAVIGVKGTKFLVDRRGDKLNVYMKEGVISVEAIKGEFKRFKQKEMDEYDAFRQETIGGFDDYKKSLNEEFAEYVKSIDVKEGQAISIDGDELRSTKIPDAINAMFDLFGKF